MSAKRAHFPNQDTNRTGILRRARAVSVLYGKRPPIYTQRDSFTPGSLEGEILSVVTMTTREFELVQIAEATMHTIGGLNSIDEALEETRNGTQGGKWLKVGDG